MVTPYWVAWIGLKNANSIGGGEGLTLATIKDHILIHSVGWAVAALELGCHVAEAELAHIEVGAIEPMGVGVLVGYKHLGHGDFICNRAECFVFDITHAIKNRALPGIESQVELPVLPVNLTADDGEIGAFWLRCLYTGYWSARFDGIFAQLKDFKIRGW